MKLINLLQTSRLSNIILYVSVAFCVLLAESPCFGNDMKADSVLRQYFETNNYVPENDKDLESYFSQAITIPNEVAARYLMQNKDSGDSVYSYYSLGKIQTNEHQFYLFARIDTVNDVKEVFLSSETMRCENCYPPLLRILYFNKGKRDLFFIIRNDLIAIFYTRRLTSEGKPAVTREIYKLDSDFTNIYPEKTFDGLYDKFRKNVEDSDISPVNVN